MDTTNDSIPLLPYSNSTEAFFPSQTLRFLIALNVAVGITCFLSFLGAGAIILSFLCFRKLRTTSRFLLFNLSIADAIVAVSNFIGVTTSYQFIGLNQTHRSPTPSCIFSATAGLYATESSILWTIAVMLYICLLTCCRRRVTVVVDRLTVVVLMVVCWCLPLVVVIVYSVRGYFGFEPGLSPGFCTIVNSDSERTHLIIAILGYEVFLFTAFITLPLLSVVFVCLFKCKVQKQSSYYTLQRHSSACNTEVKLLFVPIVFIILRIWSLIADVTTFYLPADVSYNMRQTVASAFIVFMAGVGDSAQGFANGILFCILTPVVRRKICSRYIKYCCYCSCCQADNTSDKSRMMTSDSVSNPTTDTLEGTVSNSNVRSLRTPLADFSTDIYGSRH